MAINISPNMNLPVPGVGTEDGPQYATDVNNCLTLIDQHTHIPGQGVPINPDGININDDLPFNSNNAISLRSVRFFSQNIPLAGLSDIGCLYEVLDDLFFNDGSGNQIRLTQNGAVAGTAGSIANLVAPASAAYDSGSGTFIFQSDANKPAYIDGASIILRNFAVNSFGLTLNPPAAMVVDFDITLPNLPASTQFMTINSSGQIAANIAVSQGITLTMLSPRTIESATATIGEVLRTPSSENFSMVGNAVTAVTNLTGSLQTTGRPVQLSLQADGDGTFGDGFINAFRGGGQPAKTSQDFNFYFLRDAVIIAQMRSGPAGDGSNINQFIALPSIIFLDIPSAGTYTYSVSVAGSSDGNNSVAVNACRLVAYEI